MKLWLSPKCCWLAPSCHVSNGTMLRSEQEANSPVLGFQYSLVWGVFKVELQLNSYIFYSSAWESARNFSRKTSLPYSDLRPLHKALRASRLSLQAHGWTPQLNTSSHRPQENREGGKAASPKVAVPLPGC